MTADVERAEAKYTAPVLTTRFSSKRHPAYAQLHEYSIQSCARSFIALTAPEAVSHCGAYAFCGGSYAALLFPDADFERLKPVADFFSAGAFIDDIMDNSTDMAEVVDVSQRYRAALAGTLRDDPWYDFVVTCYTDERWDPEALRLTQAEMNHYLDCALVLRRIESERRPVSVEEYFTFRATNTIMGAMHYMIGFALPELAEDLVGIHTAAPEAFQRALFHCGVSIGTLLDLYKLNGEHPEVCEYTTIPKVLQRASPVPMSLPEAVERSVEIFHEHEDKLVAALEEVAAFSPALAKAMEWVHAGTAVWLAAMRGNRYSDLF